MYHLNAVFATTRRVLQQLSHDYRTIVLILFVPSILLAVLRWVFDANPEVFDRMAPALLGIFPFTIMFLVTSIATLRERTGGTLERLMAMPIAKFDFISGYAIAFGLLAIAQAAIASYVTLGLIGVDIQGGAWLLALVALLDALLGTAIGLFTSAFAKTEFQAVQFMPAFIFPQILLSGLFVPLSQMPDILESIAYIFPVTYAVDALSRIATETDVSTELLRDFVIITGYLVAALILGAISLRRRSR